MGKNICFRPKNFKKTRFLGFSCITAQNRFAFLLYCNLAHLTGWLSCEFEHHRSHTVKFRIVLV